MPSLPDLAADLLAGPAPVLLLDACALLDLIRAPSRGAVWQLPPALRLDGLTAAIPAPCRLLKASITDQEFTDNAPGEQRQLEQYLQDLEAKADALRQAFAHLGLSFPAPSFAPSPLPAALIDLAQRLLSRAAPLDPDLSTRDRAYQRVTSKRRPARSGAIKDSVMVEEYLELCRQLRGGGFTPPCVFLTSNTNDFCEGSSRTLHGDLAGDFTTVGLTFCTTWPRAVQTLGV